MYFRVRLSLLLHSTVCYWILELFRECGIFFHFIYSLHAICGDIRVWLYQFLYLYIPRYIIGNLVFRNKSCDFIHKYEDA
jgi:hypothetical protein